MAHAARMLQINVGILVWALHFTVIYAFTAVACARGMPAAAVLGVVLAASLVAVVACVTFILVGRRHLARFESWLSAAIAGLALIAIVWEALPALLVPICV